MKNRKDWLGHIGNQKGSISAILIASAVGSIVMLAMASSLLYQQRETKALSEKMASLEIQRLVTAQLNSPAECSKLFAAANLITVDSDTFDANLVSSNQPYVLRLKALSQDPGAPAADGKPATALSNSLVLTPTTANSSGVEIEVTSVAPPLATLNIKFEQVRLVRSIRNLRFPINLQLTGPMSATKITGCSGGVAGPGNIPGLAPFFTKNVICHMQNHPFVWDVAMSFHRKQGSVAEYRFMSKGLVVDPASAVGELADGALYFNSLDGSPSSPPAYLREMGTSGSNAWWQPNWYGSSYVTSDCDKKSFQQLVSEGRAYN